jgi:hypothetical protein
VAQVEHRKPAVVAHNRFTIDDTRAHRERSNGFGGEREAIGEIVAIPADQAGGAALPMSKDTKAVVLDLVNPAGTCRRLLSRRGRQGSKRDWDCSAAQPAL